MRGSGREDTSLGGVGVAMRKKVRNLSAVFKPNSIAVIGASREPNKIGHVIVKNFVDGGFSGKVYPMYSL